MRGALAMMLGAAVTLLAMWAALRIGFAKQTMTWSSWTRDIASAAAMGMIGVLAMLPRHLRVSLDPVQAARARLPTDLDGEVRELCNRSLAIWNNAKDKLGDDDPGKQLVRDGVLKTLEVAAKSSDVKAAGASDAELAKRMEDLDQRIAAASDAEVKAQYQSARAALDDQRRYRDHIQQNRERLIARMHNHVAALEKFQLAASGLVAARAASAGATAIKQLEELSHDVAASGEALAELELGCAHLTPSACRASGPAAVTRRLTAAAMPSNRLRASSSSGTLERMRGTMRALACLCCCDCLLLSGPALADKNADAYYKEGLAYKQEGKVDEAIKALESAVAAEPQARDGVGLARQRSTSRRRTCRSRSTPTSTRPRSSRRTRRCGATSASRTRTPTAIDEAKTR